MDQPVLLIRADASARMGTGHVMRCLALAQAWQHQGGVVFHHGQCTENLRERLHTERIVSREIAGSIAPEGDAQATLDYAAEVNASWIVIDGYQFGADYLRQLKTGDDQVLVVDDFGALPDYDCDVLLNQNSYASSEFYPNIAAGASLLLGCRYALLRDEFLRIPPPVRTYQNETLQLLLTLGGSDPDNVTSQLVQTLAQIRHPLEVTVVLGGSNPHRAAVAEAMRGTNWRLLTNTSRMPELMAQADLAIAAGGSTSWELMYMGLPSLLVTLADNQKRVVEDLVSRGTAVGLGWHADLREEAVSSIVSELIAHPDRLRSMSEQARHLVDGHGAERVVHRLLGKLVCIRSCNSEDARLLFDWANEPTVRAASFHTNTIAWTEHTAWLERKLTDPDCRIYIGQSHEGTPVGMVRLDLNEKQQVVVSISVDARYRGYGYGPHLLRRALEAWQQERGTSPFVALVKTGNRASVKLFEICGFHLSNRLNYGNTVALEYHYTTATRPL
ncbi:MAG: UDP-2,4-diacetamido-2,4,6-trideoxy-beta-L-altropyranose hydrolase [Verrucomicrobia bacterium Tous-C9LFEB]|nr:MAG: UDP-2,4-diacetamido-2,4,6-trideoxy-beta-L-altropyranose hydrolase [Verrucomicrobia bacterium Tous-C9LFEB]